MKNTLKLFGIITFVVVIGFSFITCSNDTTSNIPQSIIYEGLGGGELFVLKITENTSRAVYTPQSGDGYELTIFSIPVKKSSGIVSSFSTSNRKYILTPLNSMTSFEVSISLEGNIASITGTIILENGNPETPPTTISDPVPVVLRGTWGFLGIEATTITASSFTSFIGGESATGNIHTINKVTNTNPKSMGEFPYGFEFYGEVTAVTGSSMGVNVGDFTTSAPMYFNAAYDKMLHNLDDPNKYFPKVK